MSSTMSQDTGLWILVYLIHGVSDICGIEQAFIEKYIEGLVRDCSNSIANALELLQSSTKPYFFLNPLYHLLRYSAGSLSPLPGRIEMATILQTTYWNEFIK